MIQGVYFSKSYGRKGDKNHVKTIKKCPPFYEYVSETAKYKYDKQHATVQQQRPKDAHSLSEA